MNGAWLLEVPGETELLCLLEGPRHLLILPCLATRVLAACGGLDSLLQPSRIALPGPIPPSRQSA